MPRGLLLMPRLYFRLLHGHSAKMLPPPLPFPSMLVITQFASRILAKPMVVNREPLSVLNISGMPLSNLFSRATMQNSHSRGVDISWLKTYRLYQSITTTRFTNPVLILIYVMSLAQTWSGRSTFRPPSRYGYFSWLFRICSTVVSFNKKTVL